jgi:hypothetical protein
VVDSERASVSAPAPSKVAPSWLRRSTLCSSGGRDLDDTMYRNTELRGFAWTVADERFSCLTWTMCLVTDSMYIMKVAPTGWSQRATRRGINRRMRVMMLETSVVVIERGPKMRMSGGRTQPGRADVLPVRPVLHRFRKGHT